MAFTNHNFAAAAASSQSRMKMSPSFLLLLHRRLQATSLSADNTNDEHNDDNNEKDSDDASFYRDLEFAKISKLGASIPPDQARASAIQAESDFLNAMKETRDEFQQAKTELGSKGAVDLFLNRLDDDDEEEDQSDDEDHHQSEAFQ